MSNQFLTFFFEIWILLEKMSVVIYDMQLAAELCLKCTLFSLLYWLFYSTNMFVIFVQHMYTLLPLPSFPLFPELPLQVVRFPGTWVPWLNIQHLCTNLKHIKCTSCYNVLWANPTLCCSERKCSREVVQGCGDSGLGRDSYIQTYCSSIYWYF